jgi:hypothetical protein
MRAFLTAVLPILLFISILLVDTPKPIGEQPTAVGDTAAHVKCKSITVQDGDGPALQVHATKDLVGLWLSDPKKPNNTVAIYFRKGEGATIGIYDGRKEPLACSFAVSGGGGETRFQVIDKAGKVHIFTTDELLKSKQ